MSLTAAIMILAAYLAGSITAIVAAAQLVVWALATWHVHSGLQGPFLIIAALYWITMPLRIVSAK